MHNFREQINPRLPSCNAAIFLLPSQPTVICLVMFGSEVNELRHTASMPVVMQPFLNEQLLRKQRYRGSSQQCLHSVAVHPFWCVCTATKSVPSNVSKNAVPTNACAVSHSQTIQNLAAVAQQMVERIVIKHGWLSHYAQYQQNMLRTSNDDKWQCSREQSRKRMAVFLTDVHR